MKWTFVACHFKSFPVFEQICTQHKIRPCVTLTLNRSGRIMQFACHLNVVNIYTKVSFFSYYLGLLAQIWNRRGNTTMPKSDLHLEPLLVFVLNDNNKNSIIKYQLHVIGLNVSWLSFLFQLQTSSSDFWAQLNYSQLNSLSRDFPGSSQY